MLWISIAIVLVILIFLLRKSSREKIITFVKKFKQGEKKSVKKNSDEIPNWMNLSANKKKGK